MKTLFKKRIIVFIILNIIFLIFTINNVHWDDKEQYLYDLIVPCYAIMNLFLLFFWVNTKNKTIKKLISIFNISLSIFLIFLFVGGTIVSTVDDSNKTTADFYISIILFIILLLNINIFKNINPEKYKLT